jgi:muconolactone delta-isomerase
MISNERPLPFPQRPFAQTKPRVPELRLASERLQVERKIFTLTLSENTRGRFLRITEESGNWHNCVVIPATGLDDFEKLLAKMSKINEDGKNGSPNASLE